MLSILRCFGLVIFVSVFVIRASDAHAERPDRQDFASVRAWVESQPRTFENEVLFDVKDGQIVRSERFTTAGAILGDFDGDGDIDRYDYTALQICLSFSGPGVPTPPACYVFDSDGDVDIDMQDVAVFNTAYTGPLGGVHVEAGSLFPALASPDGYYSGEPGTSGSNSLRGIARQAGYNQDDLWYAWSVIGHPVDSGEIIIANRSLPETPYLVLSPFVLGEYAFNLTVTNLFTGESGFDVTALRGAECLADYYCDDGYFCNGFESCDFLTLQCVPGDPPCDPETEICREDSSECVPRCLNDAACDDGDLCTSDACVDGVCENAEIVCDDGLFCTGTEACDSWDGSCVSYDEPCQLGSLCIENADTCADEVPVELVGQWGGSSRVVAVQGDYVYLDSGSRLLVLDIRDRSSPVLVGTTGVLSGAVTGVAISGNYAYVASEYALQVINISDPSNPVPAVGYYTGGYTKGVAVSGSYAYVVGWYGLQVINVSDPSNLFRVGGYDTIGDAMDVAVSGSYAYVINWITGLHVINVSDPSNPFRVGGYDAGGYYAYGVAVSGSYAYVANADGGFQVIDISDPTNPFRAGGYYTGGYAYDVAVSGSYAYVVSWDSLQVINISDPSNPFRVGGYDTGGYAYGVAVSGSYAYVADADGGLVIVSVGVLPNDSCNGALPVWVGSKVFRNVDATTEDGPPEASCPPLGSDVWYTLTAPYTGTATVSLCGSDFDTMIAVYAGTECPPSTPPIVCVDDSECGGETTLRSNVSFPVYGGEVYLLRIGGSQGDQGLGVMEISIAP